MNFEVLNREVLFKGRVFDVERVEARLPDGRLNKYDLVSHEGSITVVPFDQNGNVWFVRQYRHAAQQELLELPAGTLEIGEDPEACARREVREEIGMAAGSIQKIGEFFLAPGYSSEYMRVYLALDLTPDPLKGDDDEFITVELIPLEQAYHMAESGEIWDGKTLAALLLAKPYLF